MLTETKKPAEYREISQILQEYNIKYINLKSSYTIDEIKGYGRSFDSNSVCACDFYIDDIETLAPNQDLDWLEFIDSESKILLIDHHSPIEKYSKHISSTNIAIEYVMKNGVISKDTPLLINHTDCDSVLSALIMKGIIKPDDIYGKAAIAADHTGEKNDIADLLQGLQGNENLEQSVFNLFKYINNEDVDTYGKEALDKRANQRKKIEKLIAQKKFNTDKHVTYVILDETEDKIESELVPQYLPDAEIIMIAKPMKNDKNKWEINLRLGNETKGISLNTLNLPDFGGRWNAGSTKRSGGTAISPQEYVDTINRLYESLYDQMMRHT